MGAFLFDILIVSVLTLSPSKETSQDIFYSKFQSIIQTPVCESVTSEECEIEERNDSVIHYHTVLPSMVGHGAFAFNYS